MNDLAIFVRRQALAMHAEHEEREARVAVADGRPGDAAEHAFEALMARAAALDLTNQTNERT